MILLVRFFCEMNIITDIAFCLQLFSAFEQKQKAKTNVQCFMIAAKMPMTMNFNLF